MGRPFPATATAEGRQLNVPPSPGIMRQYERKPHERQSHAGRYGLLEVSRSIDHSPASFILLHASFVLLYKASWKGEPIRKDAMHISGGLDIGY